MLCGPGTAGILAWSGAGGCDKTEAFALSAGCVERGVDSLRDRLWCRVLSGKRVHIWEAFLALGRAECQVQLNTMHASVHVCSVVRPG